MENCASIFPWAPTLPGLPCADRIGMAPEAFPSTLMPSGERGAYDPPGVVSPNVRISASVCSLSRDGGAWHGAVRTGTSSRHHPKLRVSARGHCHPPPRPPAGPDQLCRPGLLRTREPFPEVALAVADLHHAAVRAGARVAAPAPGRPPGGHCPCLRPDGTPGAPCASREAGRPRSPPRRTGQNARAALAAPGKLVEARRL